MAEIIAGAYEVLGQIGAGGGGVVYLAKHLRLEKLVVLKADKRSLKADAESLRREVDLLKNLSHTYIPQVYDFFVEDDTVYTVMDYIEGESLDKPLKRGERFSQPQIIKWACQLLEALDYLHSQPPYGILHSDIKPANIMVTPQGDIRLIDFNIALALGEEGAVRVGRSFGYASPEHYYYDEPTPRLVTNQPKVQATEVMPNDGPDKTEKISPDSPDVIRPALQKTELLNAPVHTGPHMSVTPVSGTSGSKGMLLDTRSDIYSVGATLYHLLSGKRPAQHRKDVVPLDKSVASPLVLSIIEKAMEADPDDRYQSAADMLYDLEHLHENDPRTKRHKRRTRIAAALSVGVFLAGGALMLLGSKQNERLQAAYVSAEYSADALRNGDVEAAINHALDALPSERTIFDPPYIPQAQLALSNALGVYDYLDGFKAHKTIELPSAPLIIRTSPGGNRAAVMVSKKLYIYDLESGDILAELPANQSALAEMVFVDDGTIIYAADKGTVAYDIDSESELWSGGPATLFALSSKGGIVAAVDRDASNATVYDVRNGEIVKTVDFDSHKQRVIPNDVFANPRDNLLALSESGHWLASSFDDGSIKLFNLSDESLDLEFSPSEFVHFEGGFCGELFAYTANGRSGSRIGVWDPDTANNLWGGASDGTRLMQTDDDYIYFTDSDNTLFSLDRVNGDPMLLASADSPITAFSVDSVYTMLTDKDESVYFFNKGGALFERFAPGERSDFVLLSGDYAIMANRDTPAVRVMKLERRDESQFFTYPLPYEHDETHLSADGQTVMQFNYNPINRTFRVYSISGSLISEVGIPDPLDVYDQQFRRDGNESYLEVIYNDGTVKKYSARDGSLISDTPGDKPVNTFYEEFFTDKYKIVHEIHKTPAVYDRESGKFIKELEKTAELDYVTQVGDYIITQYSTAEGQALDVDRYGLLLDENCDVIAKLPYLCDILDDGTLIFDDMQGHLRKGHIYELQDLFDLAK